MAEAVRKGGPNGRGAQFPRLPCIASIPTGTLKGRQAEVVNVLAYAGKPLTRSAIAAEMHLPPDQIKDVLILLKNRGHISATKTSSNIMLYNLLGDTE